jgi:hypothetical protein
MATTDTPLTIPCSVPEPYVHVDNRALILHDGRACVMYNSAAYPWLAATLQLLIDERRATRQQGPQLFGGFLREDGSATLYAGTVHHLVTCDVTAAALSTLHERLATRH